MASINKQESAYRVCPINTRPLAFVHAHPRPFGAALKDSFQRVRDRTGGFAVQL